MIDLEFIRSIFPKASKDARRIALFFAAAQKKAIELAVSGDVNTFIRETAELGAKWSPKKFSIASLFNDPYRQAREDTRAFGRKWNLDPVFMQEMG